MSSSKLYGLYRAAVVDVRDPLGSKRVRVGMPEIFQDEIWAARCHPPGLNRVPKVGQIAWILFEAGDPDYPVCIGVGPEAMVSAGVGASKAMRRPRGKARRARGRS